MKLTVIGKYGPYPQEGGANSCYLLEENGTKILMDMGTGALARLGSVTDIRDIDAIFVSHLHYDHTSDLLPFGYLLDSLELKMNILTRYEDSDWYRLLFGSPRFNIINIDEHSEIEIKGLKLRFYTMKHPVTDTAIKVTGNKTFLYTGDTVMCDELYTAAKNVDTVLCDCAKPSDFNGPHMSGKDAISFAKNSGTKIIATHFAPGFVPSTEMTENKNIIFAQEMTTYEI